MPNQSENELRTKKGTQPAKNAVGQQGAMQQQASDSISEAQNALSQAQDAINQTGAETNPQAIQEAREQMTEAEEFLDQAQTVANAESQPRHIQG